MNYKKLKTMKNQKQNQKQKIKLKLKRKASGKKKRTTAIKKMNTMTLQITTSAEGESIFEAYLAVFIELLGHQDIYKIIISPIQVIGVPKAKLRDPWSLANIQDSFIFYQESEQSEETHYKVATLAKSGTRSGALVPSIIDPYENFQIPHSHGFCQMFAFFIAANIKLPVLFAIDNREKQIIAEANKSFLEIDNHDPNQIKASKYRHNTYMCLKYTLELIEHKSLIIPLMTDVFEQIKSEKNDHEIGKKMTFDDFYIQLTYFLNDIDSLNDYIKDILYLLNFKKEEIEMIQFIDFREYTLLKK